MRRAQRLCYGDRCDIYAIERGIDPATGKPNAEQVRRVGVDIPCHYHYTPNQEDATDVGRIKRDIMDTTDKVRFPTGVNLSNDWWLVNRSQLAEGRPSALWGSVHRIVGAPQIIEGGARYRINTQIVLTTQEENPPARLVELLPPTLAEWEASL